MWFRASGLMFGAYGYLSFRMMRFLSQSILCSLICCALQVAVDAHETHQPTALIAPHSIWRYDDDGHADAGWQAVDFDDSAWSAVAAPLGYGEAHLNQPHLNAGQLEYFLRRSFVVSDRTAIERLILRARFDDAFVLYLNGIELTRTHRLDGSRVPVREAKEFESFSLSSGALRNGRNVLAVRLVNQAPNSSDIVWDAHLLAGADADQAAVVSAPPRQRKSVAGDAIVRGPYLQNTSETAIMICWRTPIPSRGRVDYWSATGDTGDARLFLQEALPTTEHRLRLSGLQAGHTYHYRIAGDDAIHDFRTLPAAHVAVPTRIWIIGDSGTGNKNARAVYESYRAFTGARRTDVWLMLGDNAYTHGTDQQFQNAVFDLYTPLLHHTCLWPAVGNHETYWAKRDGNPLTNNQADPYLAIFEMPTQAEAGGVPSGSELYYSFDYGRTHFICLDSQISDRSKAGAMYRWLQADLEQSSDARYDWIIAYWHHPPYTHGTHNSDKERQHFDMRETFLPLLEAHGVDLTFGGHSHTYERSILMQGHYGTSDSYDPAQHALDSGDGRPEGDGSYRQAAHQGRGTIHTVAGSSGKVGRFRAPHLPFMQVNLSDLASVVVDVDGRSLQVTTLGSAGQILDSYTLRKD
jgi:hypothetical protein